MNKLNIFIFFLILFVFLSLTCNDNPIIPDTITPGKRDYVWSTDSVDYGNLLGTVQLESIWGSSATDVWGAGYTSDVRDCLWHYDGVKWTRATEGTPIITGSGGSRIVGRVWGTAINDVWAIGGRINSGSQNSEPFVMHFNGNQWTEVIGDLANMPTGCTAIFGVMKNEFWISQAENIVYYKNGSWFKYYVGENLLVWGIAGSNGNIYANAYDVSSDGNRVIILRIQNNQLSVIDETTIEDSLHHYSGKFEPSKLWASDGKLYTAWHRISVTNILENSNINQSGWQSILSLPAGQFFVNTFYHNTKDFFVSGYPSLIYHFNGSDWKNITIPLNSVIGEYSAVWTNGNEIFVCDKDNGIIYHGR